MPCHGSDKPDSIRTTRRSTPSMQMLRALTGGDADADQLLQAALASGARRVAIKRDAKAGWLGGLKPAHQLSGTQARYDIYLNPTS